MRNRTIVAQALAAALGVALALLPPSGANAKTNWNEVADALGKPGAELPGGIYRVGLPRSDLNVVVDGVVIKPSLALGSWLAFAPAAGRTVVMGDLVLTEDEIGPVMKKLAEDHIEITALHNHLLRAKPAVFYMHVFAAGDAIGLAREFHAALVLSGTPLGQSVAPAAETALSLDTAAIDKALGAKGRIAGGVYHIGVQRRSPVTMHGMTVPASMGSAVAINFQPTVDGKAAVTGDFVLTAAEVNPVLRALTANGIEVTALHNHMLDEKPRLFFMHFWADDELGRLLPGLHAALDHIAVKRAAAK